MPLRHIDHRIRQEVRYFRICLFGSAVCGAFLAGFLWKLHTGDFVFQSVGEKEKEPAARPLSVEKPHEARKAVEKECIQVSLFTPLYLGGGFVVCLLYLNYRYGRVSQLKEAKEARPALQYEILQRSYALQSAIGAMRPQTEIDVLTIELEEARKELKLFDADVRAVYKSESESLRVLHPLLGKLIPEAPKDEEEKDEEEPNKDAG